MAPVGRPRVLPRASDADPQDEIRAVAAHMFASRGYTATSTRAIAAAVGLRQASIFHYYPRKEALLADLLDETVRPTLDYAMELEGVGLSPRPAIWLLVAKDVTTLCRAPHNAGSLQLLPEVRSPQFAWFWQRRQDLMDCYDHQVQAGLARGVFTCARPELATDMVFGLVESVITGRAELRSDPATPATFADASLRLLGVGAASVAAARRAAARRDPGTVELACVG